MVLCLLPVAVYWPTIMHRYGFRDDYAVLREATEERGTVARVSTMQARPIEGVLKESVFRNLRRVDDFKWVRLGTAGLFGLLSAFTFLVCRRLKWEVWTAALVGAVIAVLPSTQIVVSWAVGWTLPLALLLTLGAFLCAERVFAREPASVMSARHVGAWVAAVTLVAISALIYQPNSLFYFTGAGLALWTHRRWSWTRGVTWFLRHVVTVATGVGLALTLMLVVLADGAADTSQRVGLEQNWWAKAGWFFTEPLQNALALIVLDRDGDSQAVQRFAALLMLIVLAAVVRSFIARGWRRAAWWTLAMAAVVVGSFAVNLAVADRWPAYRVLFPLAATVAVILAIALLTLGGPRLARVGLMALLVPGTLLARRQSYDLVALPQSLELRLMEDAAARVDPAIFQKIYVITPTAADHIPGAVYRDEFGSLSTNSDWVPKEMLKVILRDRYPDTRDFPRRYAIETGPAAPPAGAYDVVIDMTRVREFRERIRD